MVFSQISLLLVVAAFFGIVVKKFKQPVLIGYIFAGFALAVTGVLKDYQLVDNLGKVGVALLLFLVGLEMNVRELKTIGKVAFYTGIGQVVFTFIIGFIVGTLLGFNLIVSSYLAIAVSFSSTIIIIKLLSEKNSLNSLYGKISVGFLLVQDFIAIFILIFLAGIGWGGMDGLEIFLVFIKAGILLGSIWFLSKKILPILFEKFVAMSHELLFIVSIAWALGLSSLVAGPFGLTLEMGGFLAGLALSNLPEHLEIGSRTRPLRDFFLTLFFLSLGANLVVDDILKVFFPAVIFSMLVIIGKPLIVMSILGIMRFRKRTSFLTSISVAQISEFSLLVIAMGVTLGHLQKEYLSLTVMVAVITMTISTYLMQGVEKIYTKIKASLSIFERKSPKDLVYLKEEAFYDHVVLVGCLRTGVRLLPFFEKKNIPYVVVDFNPDVYKKLTSGNHPVIFGDITDPDILHAAQIDKAKLIISTIDSLSDNSVILEYVRHLKKKPLCIFTSGTRTNALRMYERGADYVVVPEIVAGDHIRNLLRIYGIKGGSLKKAGHNHFNRLVFT